MTLDGMSECERRKQRRILTGGILMVLVVEQALV